MKSVPYVLQCLKFLWRAIKGVFLKPLEGLHGVLERFLLDDMQDIHVPLALR